MRLPNSPCASCSRGRRCTAKSDVCKKFWDWFKPAWAEAVRPLRAVKLKRQAIDNVCVHTANGQTRTDCA